MCDGKFIVTSDMIITPGAKDKIRAANLETIYEKRKNVVLLMKTKMKELAKKMVVRETETR